MLRYIASLGLGLLIIAAIACAVALSGLINVSARYEDPKLLGWFLHTTYHNSVAMHATGITPPASLDSEAMVLKGARNFKNMCMTCHTPPGLSDTPVRKGLNPAPPQLTKLVHDKTPAEIFWVINNGVRMTGMPAFGPTHEDEELWALVAFVQRMQDADPAGYRELIAKVEKQLPAEDGHGHRHGNENHGGLIKNGQATDQDTATTKMKTHNGHDHDHSQHEH